MIFSICEHLRLIHIYYEHRIELFLTQLQIHIGNPKPTLQLNGFNLNLNDNATQYTLHTRRRAKRKNAKTKRQIRFDVYFLRFRFVRFCSHSEYFNGENLMKKLKLEVKNIDSVM